MRCGRVLILLILIVLVFPYDNYLSSTALKNDTFRWFWANEHHILRMPLSGVSQMNINMKGCSLIFKSYSDTKFAKFNISQPYGTNPKIDGSTLTVTGKDSEYRGVKCVIMVSLPHAGTGATLPSITIDSKGETNPRLRIYEEIDDPSHYFNFGSNSLKITAQLMNIYLHRPHIMKDLNIDIIDRGQTDLKKLSITGTATISQTIGNINVETDKEVITTQATESNGQVCLSGGGQSLTANANCPNAATRAAIIPFNNGQVDTTNQCSVSGSLCSNTSCSASSSFTLNAKTNDGSVVIRNTGGTGQSTSYLRNEATLDVYSQSLIKNFAEKVKDNPTQDYIYIMDVFAPGYEGVWYFATNRAYIIGVPWVLSAVSGSLLQSTIIRVKMYISDNTCPTRDVTSIQYLTDVSKQIQSYLVTSESTILVQHKTLDRYYTYIIDDEGKPHEEEVSIDYINGTFIAAYCISGFIAIYGTIQALIILYKLLMTISISYKDYLEKQRHFAQVKFAKENNSSKSTENEKDGLLNKTKVFNMGLFFGGVKTLPTKTIRKDKKDTIFSILTQYSFFTVIQLLYESKRRQKENSLYKYLSTIRPSAQYFPKNKYQESSQAFDTTLDVAVFDEKYYLYCVQEGYNPMLIEDCKDTLRLYGLSLHHKLDKNTKAYTKIRWKRDEERRSHTQVDKDVISADNSINLFLEQECVKTQFKSDHIFTSDLESAYYQYCKVQGVPKYKIERIVGSPELIKFGAELDESFAIRVLKNITTDENDELVIIDLDYEKVKLKFTQRLKLIYRGMYRRCWGVNGILTLTLQVLINYIAVLVIILPLNIQIHFVYGQKSRYRPDVYSTYYDMKALAEPDSYHWYGNELENFEVVLAGFWYTVTFYIIAVAELVGFFTIGFLNTGKYPVQMTYLKRILTMIFWLMFFINLFIYISFILLFLVWFVLGATINPNRFLPYATTSITLISFIYINKNRLNKFYDDLIDHLQEMIKKKMMFFLKKTLEQLAGVINENEISKKLVNQVEKVGKETFIKQILGSIGKNIQEIDPQLISRLVEGDQEAFEELISSATGMHEGLTKALFAMFNKNKDDLINAVQIMADEVEIDKELASSIVEIFLSQFSVSLKSGEKISGQAVVAIKKVCRQIFPELDLNILDNIIPIVTGGDFRPLIGKMEEFSTSTFDKHDTNKALPISLLRLIEGMMNKRSLHDQHFVGELFSYLFKNIDGKVIRIFVQLYKFSLGLTFEDYIDDIVNLLDLKDLGFILNMISFVGQVEMKQRTKAKINMMFKTILKLMRQEMELPELEIDEEPFFDKVQAIINVFSLNRAYHTIMLDAYEAHGVSLHNFVTIDNATYGSLNDFIEVLDRMKMPPRREILIQLYTYYMHGDQNLVSLGQLLNMGPYVDECPHIISHFYLTLKVSDVLKKDSADITQQEKDFYRHKICRNMFNIKKLMVTIKHPKREYKELEKVYEAMLNLDPKGGAYISDVVKDIQTHKVTSKYFTSDVMNTLKSLATVQFYFDKEKESINNMNDDAIEFLAKRFQYRQEDLEFIFDIFSKSPNKIFGVMPKTKLQSKDVTFSQKRQEFLINFIQTINQENFRDIYHNWNNKQGTIDKGNKELDFVCTYVFDLPKDYIEFIRIKKQEREDTTIMSSRYDEMLKRGTTINRCIEHLIGKTKTGKSDLDKVLDEYYPIHPDLVPEMYKELAQPNTVEYSNMLKMTKIMMENITGIFIKFANPIAEMGLVNEKEFVYAVQKYLLDQSTESYLKTILEASKCTMANSSKIGDRISELKNHSKRNSLIQMALIFGAAYLQNDSNIEQMQMGITHLINSVRQPMNHIKGPYLGNVKKRFENKNFLVVLFEEGFFSQIVNQLFNTSLKKATGMKSVRNPETMLGVILGVVLKDKNLIVTSLVEFLKHIIPEQIARGAVAMCLHELSYEGDIRNLLKAAGEDQDKIISMLNIMSDNPQRLAKSIEKYQPGIYENYEKVASYVRLFKGDISALRNIGQHLNVDQEMLQAVFSMATGNMQLSRMYFPKLRKFLNIDAISSFEPLLEIVNGELVHVIQVQEKHVLNAMLYFTKVGKKYKGPANDNTYDPYNMRDLTRQISILMIKLQNSVKNFSIEYEVEKEFGAEGEETIQIRFQAFLVMITLCLWGEWSTIEKLCNILTHNIDDPDSVWNIDKLDHQKLLRFKLRELYNLKKNKYSQIHKRRTTRYKEKAKEYFLMEAKLVENIGLTEQNFEVQLRELGCSVRLGDLERIEQTAYFCYTCQDNNGQNYPVCAVCAHCCHKGHTLERNNFGIKTQVLCKCLKMHCDNKHSKFDCQFTYDTLDPLPEESKGARIKQEESKKANMSGNAKQFKDVHEQNFEKAKLEYTVEDFIIDLEDLFPFSEEVVKSEYLREHDFKIYDSFEERRVSFIDNWIQMVCGNMRESFIPLFLGVTEFEEIHEQQTNIRDNDSIITDRTPHPDYGIVAACVSLCQGNHIVLNQYARFICEPLKIYGQSKKTETDILMNVHMLVNGVNEFYDDDTPQFYQPEKQYHELFKELFGKESVQVQVLHCAVTFPREQFLDMIDKKCEHVSYPPKFKERYNLVLKHLFQGNQEREEKFNHLLILAHREEERLDEEAIDYNGIQERANRKLQWHLGKHIRWIGRMNNQHLHYTFRLKYCIEQKGIDKWHHDFWGNQQMVKLSEYIDKIVQCVSSATLNMEHALEQVLKLGEDSDTNDKYRDVLIGLKGVLQINVNRTMTMWNSSNIDSSNKKKIKTIMSIMMHQWNLKDIKHFIRYYADDPEYCEWMDRHPGAREWLIHKDTPYILINQIRAINGDNNRLAQLLDEVVYQNRSCIHTLCMKLMNDSSWRYNVHKYNLIRNQDDSLAYTSLVKREIYQLFMRLISQSSSFKDVDFNAKLGKAVDKNEKISTKLMRRKMSKKQVEEEKEGGENDDEESKQSQERESLMEDQSYNEDEEAGMVEFKEQNTEHYINNEIKLPYVKIQFMFKHFLHKFHIPEIIIMVMTSSTNILSHLMHFKELFDHDYSDIPYAIFKFIQSKQKMDAIEEIIKAIPGFNLDPVLHIPNVPNLLEGIDLDQIKEIFDDQDIDYDEGLDSTLKKTMSFEYTTEGVYIKFVKLVELMMQIKIGENEMMWKLLLLIRPIFQDLPVVPQLIQLVYLLLKGSNEDKRSALKYIPNIMLMLLICAFYTKDAVHDKETTPFLQEKHAIIGKGIYKLLLLILEKPNKDHIVDLLDLSCKYADVTGNELYVIKVQNRIPLIASCLYGLICLVQKDFKGMTHIAKLLGNFDQQQFEKISQKILRFTQLFSKNIKSLDKEKIQGAVKGMMNDLMDEAFDVSDVFTIFDKDQSGYIDFNEFRDLDKYMGFDLGRQKMVQLFAKSDKDKDNLINYDEFVEAQLLIRIEIARAALGKVGLTVGDLIYFFVQSVIILVLLQVSQYLQRISSLAFIIIGVVAMSTQDSFTSIVNSILPCLAGLGVSSKSFDIDESLKKLKDVVNKVLDAMKSNI